MVKARNSEDEGTARRDGARTPEVLAYAPLNEIKAGPREMRCSAPEADESMQETREKLIDLAQARHILKNATS